MSDSNLSFSIVLPIYNRAILGQRAILSITKQSYSFYECLIIEDGSSSALPSFFLNEILKDKRFQYIHLKKNRGVSFARNKGIQLAKYPKICFLDSDDEWQQNKLQADADFIAKNNFFLIHHSDSFWMRKGKKVNLPKKFENNCGAIFYQSLKYCMIAISNVVIDKKVFEQIGFFNEKLKCCEDYELFLKISSLYSVGKINQKLVIRHQNYREQKIKINFNNKMILYEICNEEKQLSSNLLMDQFRITALKNFIIFSNNKILKFFACREIIRRCWILIRGLKRNKKLLSLLYLFYYKGLKKKYQNEN